MEKLKEDISTRIESGKKSLLEGVKEFTRFDEKNWMNNLPLLLLAAILGVVHVANNHLVEYKIRKINSLERDIKELRWNYMTSKSELMFQSKQSEVAKVVKDLGLRELLEPPNKIEVEKNEYE